MKIVNTPRGSGKTIMLIRLSAMTDQRIITLNKQAAERIEKMAKRMGLKIPKPLSYSEAHDFRTRERLSPYLIDEYDLIAEAVLEQYLQNKIDFCTTSRNIINTSLGWEVKEDVESNT